MVPMVEHIHPDDIEPGDRITWPTWCGPAKGTVTNVTRINGHVIRISVDDELFAEAPASRPFPLPRDTAITRHS